MKYDFSIMGQTDNAFIGLMLEVNNAMGGFWTPIFLALIFFVSFYSIIKVTNDVEKTGIISCYIVMLLSLLLYYGGKLEGFTLINDLLMAGIIVIFIVGLSTIYFMRNKGG
jgi:hypothetical protein